MLSEVVGDGQIIESYGMPDHDDSHHLVTHGQTQEITTVTGDTTLNKTYHTVLVDATGGNRIITLPPASTSNHRIFVIIKIDISANTVTIDANSSETINGAPNQVLSSQWEKVMIQCNGTEWFIV